MRLTNTVPQGNITTERLLHVVGHTPDGVTTWHAAGTVSNIHIDTFSRWNVWMFDTGRVTWRLRVGKWSRTRESRNRSEAWREVTAALAEYGAREPHWIKVTHR